MKRKVLFGFIFAILLASSVFAGVLMSNIDKTLDVSVEQKEALESEGIEVYDKQDLQKGDSWQRCLLSRNDYNLPCNDFVNMNGLTQKEINEKLDAWEDDFIRRVANATIEKNARQLESEPELKGEGKTTTR